MSHQSVFHVEVQFDAAMRALSGAPEVFEQEMLPAVIEAQFLLEREIRERTPTSGAGTLRDSIGALPVTFSEARFEASVGTSLAYALPVELGAKPHRPPVEPLIDWVARKLGKRGAEGKGIAWAIAGKIARDGTRARNMFSEGLAATQGQIAEILSGAADRALARISP